MLKLFDHPLSGNCYKVRLFMHMSGLPFETEFLDVLARKNMTDAFGRISPLRQIPVLQDGDTHIPDSHAILVYLARKHARAWLPDDPVLSAEVTQWLVFSAKEIAESLQPQRLYHRFGAGEAGHHMGLLSTTYDAEGGAARCRTVLGVLEHRLRERSWLVGEQPTIADIACYPYVSLADEAGFDLRDYPSVHRWCVLITRLPGFAPMVAPRTGTSGEVVGLHTAPRAMLPMRNMTELHLVEGLGVQGDRYATGRGYLTEKIAEFGVTDQRHLTLFQEEVLDDLAAKHHIRLQMNEHRRNVTTRGVDLNRLIGQRFRIGDAELLGFETTPCKHLEEVTGHPIAPLLVNRSGLNARIVKGGPIRVGDRVEML